MFQFSVAPMQIGNKQIEGLQKTNGLLRVLQIGYSQHVPVAIRPDDVLNAIGCLWAKYVGIHAERLRRFFVSHEGRKTLEYKSAGEYSHGRLPEFVAGLTALIKNDQENDNLSWLEFDGSTTNPGDRFVRAAAMLASQKAYYDYRVTLCCGFSYVTLLGTDADWDAVEFAIQAMPTPDDDVGNWQRRLLHTIAGMRSGEEAFWQRCITNQAFGSGPRDYDGWILDFNPFNERGEWLARLEDDDVLDLTVDFPLHVNDNGREFDVFIEAGPTQLRQDGYGLQPRTVFVASRSEQEVLALD